MATLHLANNQPFFGQNTVDGSTTFLSKSHFYFFFIAGVLLHATSLFNGIMEGDAMLYATISKNIATSNDWVNLVGNGQDWLDKPHLPFWITAISIKIFGINDFAYKFPAFIIFLVGVMYTYLMAKKMFTVDVARIGTIIYLTSFHLFLAVFDVRAEAYLTTFVIAAIFHIYCAMPKNFSWHILWAAFFCGAACSTKGIFVLATIASGFIVFWIYNKQWQQFIQPKWWLLLLLTFVFILPELYCLYQQFDLHPEKVIFDTVNVSGIKFFFWDSQFGRFFNNGPIKGEGDPFFFVHTFLWAFFPWSFIGVVGIYVVTKKIKRGTTTLLIIMASAFITFLLFSFSRFQLPHYLVIIFPHFAIISAVYLCGIGNKKVLARWNYLLLFLFLLVVVAVVVLCIISRFNYWVGPSIILAIGFIILYAFKENKLSDVLGKGLGICTLLFLYLNLFFYPVLLNYQGGMDAAKMVNNLYTQPYSIMYQCNTYAFEWYSKAVVVRSSDLKTLPQNVRSNQPLLILTTLDNVDKVKAQCSSVTELSRFQNFRITLLTFAFLQANTRKNELNYFVLLRGVLK